jgi:hypothetical protein
VAIFLNHWPFLALVQIRQWLGLNLKLQCIALAEKYPILAISHLLLFAHTHKYQGKWWLALCVHCPVGVNSRVDFEINLSYLLDFIAHVLLLKSKIYLAVISGCSK